MTTNGFLLPRYIAQLRHAGLKRLTVSLDTLDPALFAKLAGRDFNIAEVLSGLQKARQLGFESIKINTVVQKGVNDHEIVDLAQFARQHGFIIRFIEYMDVGNLNHWSLDDVVTGAEVVQRIGAVLPLEPIDANYRGEVASRYRYLDGRGEVGIIASVSRPFCGQCTRIRLSADGKLYTCLFADHGHDVKDAMRNDASDQELQHLIETTWAERADRYSQTRFESGNAGRPHKVEMYHIGG
jgi:cyclic pyranopterin phosphate synthase